MKIRSNRRHKKYFALTFLGAFLVVAVAGMLFSPKASANLFPSDSVLPNGAPGDHLAISSIQNNNWGPDGGGNVPFVPGTGKYNCKYPSLYPRGQDAHACATGLDAQSTYYELYMPKPAGLVPQTTLTIQNACGQDGREPDSATAYNKPNQPDKGARRIRVSAYKITADGGRNGGSVSSTNNYNTAGTDGHCSGSALLLNVPASAFTNAQNNRYGNDGSTLTALVEVYKLTASEGGGPGNKTFRLATGGAVSVYGAPGDYFAEVDRYPPGYIEYNNQGPDPTKNKDPTTYAFTFVPDCKFRGGKVTIGLDALSLESHVQPQDINIYLLSPGQVQRKRLTFQDHIGWTTPEDLQRGQGYILYLADVGADNGIKVNLPYGQYQPPNLASKCVQEPHHDIHGQCNTLTVHDNGVYNSPNHGTVKSRSRVTVTSPPGGTLVNNESVGYHGTYPTPANDSHTWNYTPGGPKVTISVHREMAIGNNTWAPEDGNGGADATQGSGTYTCYLATCSLSVTGDGPNGIVLAGGKVHVRAVMYNPGPDPSNSELLDIPPYLPSGPRLSVTIDGAVKGEHDIGTEVPNGDQRFTAEVPFDVPAATTITDQTINAYPDFWGYGSFAPTGEYRCSATFPVFQHFNINPSAQIVNTDPEKPSTVSYNTTGSKTEGPDINATAKSRLTVQKKGAPPETIVKGIDSIGHSYGSFTDSFTYNPPNFDPGDNYCAYVKISPANGYIGPGGVIADPHDVEARSPSCLTVINEPYAHFFGADVSAGGGFEGDASCTHAGGIYAYTSDTGVKAPGSGVQIGALAIGPIAGFNSANLRGVAPTGSTGLSFSNTTGAGGIGKGAPLLGGNLGGSHCVTDYFSKMPEGLTPNTVATSISANVASPGSANYYKRPAAGPALNITGGAIGDDADLAVYVTGDVYITAGATGGIKFANTNWPSLEKVPSFYLVVKGGNIYIDPGVKQLDGVYVAQPDSGGHGGTINTCATPAVQYSGAALLASCKSQLVVNGAFVAKQVDLHRAFGSLRNSYPGEYLNAARPPSSPDCGDSGPATLGDCAAEIFNFSPEIYIAQPAIKPGSGPTTGKFDYITSLSPVL